MIREFSEALNINLTSLTETFYSREKILANNRLPKQNAGADEWDSFRKGIKKDILGDSSLLYDLSMSHDQKSKLIEFLRANILLAKCLHVSDTLKTSRFENSLVSLKKAK